MQQQQAPFRNGTPPVSGHNNHIVNGEPAIKQPEQNFDQEKNLTNGQPVYSRPNSQTMTSPNQEWLLYYVLILYIFFTNYFFETLQYLQKRLYNKLYEVILL